MRRASSETGQTHRWTGFFYFQIFYRLWEGSKYETSNQPLPLGIQMDILFR